MFPQKPPRWIFGIVAGLILFGIGSLLYSNGWSQGFTTGLLVTSTDGANLTPYFAYRAGPGLVHGGIGFFGFVFRAFFFFLLFGLIFKAASCWRRRMHGGPGPQWHGRHGWHGHGPHGSWGGQPQQSEQPEQPQQSSEGGASPNEQKDAAGQSAAEQSGEDGGTRPVSWQSPVINV